MPRGTVAVVTHRKQNEFSAMISCMASPIPRMRSSVMRS